MTFVLAATTQQKIGIAIAIVVLIAWLVYIYSTTRRTAEPGSEIEIAPTVTAILWAMTMIRPLQFRAVNRELDLR